VRILSIDEGVHKREQSCERATRGTHQNGGVNNQSKRQRAISKFGVEVEFEVDGGIWRTHQDQGCCMHYA
jgi:hypothetical protein